MKTKLIALAGASAILGLSACATLEEEAVDLATKTYHATLTGAAEVGGGDPDGRAMAEISISDTFDQVCYDVKDISGIGEVTAAHIHFAPAGANGPPVFTLTKSNEGKWQGCKSGAEWTQNRLNGNPEAFYVNLHTGEFPGGAIRGQLHD